MRRRTVEVLGGLSFAISAYALTQFPGHRAEAEPEPAIAQVVEAPPTAEPVTESVERPRIDLVFALDTTGSMGGLIEGAKKKIWALANEIADGEPRPDLRIALIAYRDKGDSYVTKTLPFGSDMDEVFEHLSALQAAGGGDGPEHVNKALFEAVHELPWRTEPNTLKLVFLVGDAPPHDDYKDTPTSRELAQQAAAKGIVINAVRCGVDTAVEQSWQQIASLSGGRFDTVAQDGGMQDIVTPYDEALARLNAQLADTAMAYGSAHHKRKAHSKLSKRRGMGGSTAASTAGYSAKKGGKLFVEDLVGAVEEGLALDEVAEAELPEVLQKMDKADRKAAVQAKQAERKALKKKILELDKERSAFIEKNTAPADKDAFDARVMEGVKEQAAKIGVAY